MGVMLDGVDSFIYALVLIPAMKEILPQSGIEASPGNLGYFGSILVSMFLIGWGMAFLWGPLADRYGRVRSLTLAVLCYSLFTFLGSVAHNVWELGIFRLLAGFGVGGEFVGAATFVAEELPEERRVQGAGIFNSGYYVGTFLAAGLNYGIGARYGWRAMFAVGGLPALYFALMTISISSGFGYAFYLPHRALAAFLPCLFLVGVGGGSFSVYWAWMPEQYHTECRGSALAFATCIGRFVAAGATFIVGIGI